MEYRAMELGVSSDQTGRPVLGGLELLRLLAFLLSSCWASATDTGGHVVISHVQPSVTP